MSRRPVGQDWRIDAERQLPRLKQSLKILLPDGWTGEVVDLSASGLKMRSLVLLPVNTELEATLVLPGDKRIALTGRIVWANPPQYEGRAPGEYGMELDHIPQSYFDALADLFAKAD